MPAPQLSEEAGFRLGIYVCKDAEIVDFAAPHGVFSVARRLRSRARRLHRRRGAAAGAGAGRLHRAAELRLQRRARHGRVPDPRRLRAAAGDQQRPAARVHPRAAGEDAAGERVHRLVDLRPHGAARRQGRDQPQGAGPARSLQHGQGADRSPGRDCAEMPDQPRARGRCRPHHLRRRHQFRHGGGLPPAAPRRLRRGLHRRRRAGDGVQGGVRRLQDDIEYDG